MWPLVIVAGLTNLWHEYLSHLLSVRSFAAATAAAPQAATRSDLMCCRWVFWSRCLLQPSICTGAAVCLQAWASRPHSASYFIYSKSFEHKYDSFFSIQPTPNDTIVNQVCFLKTVRFIVAWFIIDKRNTDKYNVKELLIWCVLIFWPNNTCDDLIFIHLTIRTIREALSLISFVLCLTLFDFAPFYPPPPLFLSHLVYWPDYRASGSLWSACSSIIFCSLACSHLSDPPTSPPPFFKLSPILFHFLCCCLAPLLHFP